MPQETILSSHIDTPVMNGQGPLTGLTHQTLVGAVLGAQNTTVWQHHMTTPLVVPPHYHDVEETVIVLSGCLRFRIAGHVDNYAAGADPLAGADVIDCGPEATFVIPAGRLHGYEITGIPARVLIIMPDAHGKTRLPAGEEMALPWQ